MSHRTGLEDPLVLIVNIHVVRSDSLYQTYMQFLCFPQKLDDARFGIQPVDDDDGKILFNIFCLLWILQKQSKIYFNLYLVILIYISVL